jgi:hypothetical protein
MADTDSDIARRVIREAEAEQADRANFDALWEETRRRIIPSAARFQGRDTPGERRTEWQFDSMTVLAAERCAAVFLALNMPRSEKYQTIQATERSIRKMVEVRQWCEALRDDMFDMRYATSSNFASQLIEVIMSRVCFGNGAMMIEDNPGKPTNYKSLPLPYTWWREAENGKANWVLRKLHYKPYQAIEKFGEANLPDTIKSAAVNKPNQEFIFWQMIAPNDKRNPRIRGPEGMGFTSHYIAECEKTLIQTGGFRVFPVAIARATTASNERYGRGPAQTVLADVKMRNEMRKSILRSTNRMADPTLLVSDDTALMPFSLRPGFRNRGYITDEGVKLAEQLKWEGDLNPAMLLDQQTGEVIKDAMLLRVFEMMLANPNMTATEVLERLKERAILLSPDGSKFMDEFGGSLTEREVDILAARGRVRDMPEPLLQARGEIDVIPNGPLARAQRAEEATGFSRTVEQIVPIAQVDPEQMLRFKMEEIVPDIAEIHGMPARWLLTKEEFDELRRQMAEEKAQQTALAAAQPLATAAKDASQARLFSQQAGM